MQSFVIACVAAIIIAVIAVFALNYVQETASNAFATSNVRLDAGA